MQVAAEMLAGGARTVVEIRQVWAYNVEEEFHLIRAAAEHLPYVAMDTEFPGVIHRPAAHPASLTPADRYALLRSNVDELHLIQVGLTLAAAPDAPPSLAFEINLREFDPRVDLHAPESVRLLASSGLDFAALRAHGVDARVFSALLMSSGLVCSDGVCWVAFHSGYDFGYLLKLLMGLGLPASMADFLHLVRVFFGAHVYDVKHMMTRCDHLQGGLERVAATLKVQRAAGRCHQAGSDSLLTWDTFRRIRQLYFPNKNLHAFAGVLFGLELGVEQHLKKQPTG